MSLTCLKKRKMLIVDFGKMIDSNVIQKKYRKGNKVLMNFGIVCLMLE